MLRKKLVVAAMTSALVMTGTSAFAFGTKSTALSNGTLSVSASDGCQVSGNCTLYYSSTTYKKTGGNKVTIQLAMDDGNSLFLDTQKSISSGQTLSHSWGGKRKSDTESCDIAGYMKASTGNYYTPNVDVC
ncbi:hypothetical protein QQY66_15985 [Streptomyces sp. DG2A-72]|uniref:hypothetical protein n=1 Tax=Streptomyces sp. DG2A-72 TaxID=3051386 RepID=UPI00265B9FB7|nr:hypothetical protein [Streptomyces sp. DG2A-72]MDO0933118.1 hypothetical protein [Streptomyces sp. DG2A-72]